MKVVSGFHLRTDVQLWALAVSVAYNEMKWLEKKGGAVGAQKGCQGIYV